MSRSIFPDTSVATCGLWSIGFLAFPLSGLAGRAIAGPVDSLAAALLGGLITGAVIGAGQWLASGRRLGWARWIPATAVGMSAGLAAGALTVNFGTDLGDLALMGAVTGVFLGFAQAIALPASAVQRWLWAAAMPALWALGWTVTTMAGVDVQSQYTVYGASGALTFSALSGLLLLVIMPPTANTRVQSAA